MVCPLHTQEKRLRTNPEMMGDLTGSVARQLFKDCQMDSLKAIVLVSPSEDGERIRFIQGHLLHVLTDRSGEIYFRADTLFQGIEIVWHPLSVSVNYLERLAGRMLASPRIVRRGVCSLFFEIRDVPAGRAMWAGTISRTQQDTIAAAALDHIEQGGTIFGKPVRPGVSGWRRLIEPLVMMGTLGLMGYLFYTIRS